MIKSTVNTAPVTLFKKIIKSRTERVELFQSNLNKSQSKTLKDL